MISRLCLTAAPALLLLAGCTFGAPSQQSRANQVTVAACRERAESAYVEQNRDLLYQNDNSTTPYSAGPSTGIPTHGLSSLYAHQQAVDDCVRNTGTQTERNDNDIPGVQAPPHGQGAGPPSLGVPP